MDSLATEIVIMWVTVSLYAAGSVLYAAGFVFRLQKVMAVATWVSLAGIVPHCVAIGVRWVRVGHAPYLGFCAIRPSDPSASSSCRCRSSCSVPRCSRRRAAWK
jgi:hypothetical protein